MKITSADCKVAIVQHCRDDANRIKREFTPALSDEDFKPALQAKNWKRRCILQIEPGDSTSIGPRNYTLEGAGPGVFRGFDCGPFDDQLRAEVLSADGEILAVWVEGE